MSNYNVQISWSGKDALSDSDPAKVISGTDFQTEFDAVQTAINSKPEVADVLTSVYPVGSIYINATNSTNPASLLGFGTWVAFGAGRVPVGFDSSDTDFDTAEETGGSKDTVAVSHGHTSSASVTDPGHDHGLAYTAYPDTFAGGSVTPYRSNVANTSATSVYSDTTGISVSVTVDDYSGSDGVGTNLQPYIVVYMWKRTA